MNKRLFDTTYYIDQDFVSPLTKLYKQSDGIIFYTICAGSSPDSFFLLRVCVGTWRR